MLVDDDVWLRFLLTVNRSVSLSHGYPVFNYESKLHKFHRWVLGVTNPLMFVGHLNSVKSHNHKKNLYQCTKSENQRNLNDQLRLTNISGTRGVDFNTRDQVWIARGSHDNIHTYLGSFQTKELAIRARQQFEDEHGYYCTR